MPEVVLTFITLTSDAEAKEFERVLQGSAGP